LKKGLNKVSNKVMVEDKNSSMTPSDA
jgi:hypothetical protein